MSRVSDMSRWNGERPSLDPVILAIRELLADGALPSSHVKLALMSAGHAPATVSRAARVLSDAGDLRIRAAGRCTLWSMTRGTS